ncbi:helix-turn-helix domain-containing protein [Vibrio parahaemolyticus]|uniref:helix-turn-helix domain-containing protein n=1 Tax=Vibrio parahaemolyticus TaxID=670 RepID=UPI0015DE3B5C
MECLRCDYCCKHLVPYLSEKLGGHQCKSNFIFRLICLLSTYSNKVFSNAEISKFVWGDHKHDQRVASLVCQTRQVIPEGWHILNIHGKGYLLVLATNSALIR